MNDELKKIVDACHDRPHQVLGPHRLAGSDDMMIIRAFIPHALEVSVFIKRPIKKAVRMKQVHPDGLYEVRLTVGGDIAGLDYVLRITDENKERHASRDPYNFVPADLDADEEAAFVAGRHSYLFKRCGAHLDVRDATEGVRFGIWAPHARRISVVGTFNHWDGRCHPMQRIGPTGLWELFIPGGKVGDLYKFEIRTPNGAVFLKTDPYAFRIEESTEAAAIVCDQPQAYEWRDDEWMRRASPTGLAVFNPVPKKSKISVKGLAMTDKELARIGQQGYSHLEISAICDTASDNAMLFLPNPLLGTPQQVMALIDRCHLQGVGVIIDVAPLGLAKAQKNLVCFDGAPLYERLETQPSDGFSFDCDNPGVKNLMLSYVRFWRDHYHIDGFRLDNEIHHLYRELMETCAAEHPGMIWLSYQSESVFTPAKEVVMRLFQQRRLADPFAILGPHQHQLKNTVSIRAILPNMQQAYVHFPERPAFWYQMQRQCAEGLWQALIPLEQFQEGYRLHTFDADGIKDDRLDTYAYDVSYLSASDKKLFAAGNHYRIYEVLGAHLRTDAGVDGVNFSVWAPNAAAVNVVGDFNGWDGRGHPMRLHADVGVWELFIPGVGEGDRYQFEVFPQRGSSFRKSDPYAFYMETAPATGSVVYRIEGIFQWQDQEWLRRRESTNVWRMPISIYEVHLASWRRGEGNRLLNYTEIAEKLIPYVKDMGFSHIEILPIAEHPYEPSWGYQVSNFYAPTSRLGQPEDLMAFVDQCHQHGIGVLLDWVAGHFPKDSHALSKFDGTHLYEHEDPRKGEHKDWGTLIFNYGRHEAENFLIANALFWLEYYHFDGLRVDAVASMLYLDYSRKDGEWIPNIYGGNENLEAIEFLKHTNYVVHGKFPGVMMIAEESTAWAGVSRPTDAGGLGFGFKWNMGWMHDILGYLQTPPEYRPYHHNRLAFIFHYAFEENFILSLSHDEVVHLKGSLYRKMPGAAWEKFANLRLLFFFMYTHPGKKLNFMGAEFAQSEEWNESSQLQWHMLDIAANRQLQSFVKTLNDLYRNEPVLYEMDCRPAGFAWIESNNHEQSIIVFSRKAKDPRIALIVVINFSAISRFNFRIGVPYPVSYTEIFNTNVVEFGGLTKTAAGTRYAMEDTPWHGQEFSIKIDRLPALSAMLLKPDAARED